MTSAEELTSNRPRDNDGVSTLSEGLVRAIRIRLAILELPDRALAAPLRRSQNYVSERMRRTKPFTVDDVDAIAPFLGLTPLDLIAMATSVQDGLRPRD